MDYETLAYSLKMIVKEQQRKDKMKEYSKKRYYENKIKYENSNLTKNNSNDEVKFHCDICNKTIQQRNKYYHDRSKKHIKNSIDVNAN